MWTIGVNSVLRSRHFFGRLRLRKSVRGPGADSGFDQLGSAQAPGKKRRLQAAPAPFTKIFYFKLLKSLSLMQVFLWS